MTQINAYKKREDREWRIEDGQPRHVAIFYPPSSIRSRFPSLWVLCVLLWLTNSFISPARAQVQVLPPDFTLFGKTSRDYLVELYQAILPLSTNGDYLLPRAVPSATEPVYFLQRPSFGVAAPVGIQTYFIPDNVYVCFPITYYAFDNIDTDPPWTIDQLRQALDAVVDTITNVYAIIDNVAVPNASDYRTRTPVFSIFFPTNDNIISAILGHPFEGLDDPVVGEGYR